MSTTNPTTQQRAAAGDVRSTLCRQCHTGTAAGDLKTFDPRCRGCLEKLRTGKRTGLEPRPMNSLAKYRKRVARATFVQQVAANHEAGKIRKAQFLAQLACSSSSSAPMR